MLDILLGYGITYSDYYMPWGLSQAGTSTSIQAGAAQTCILPPIGCRSTIIGGRDLKIVVDWMALLSLFKVDGEISANPKSIAAIKSTSIKVNQDRNC